MSSGRTCFFSISLRAAVSDVKISSASITNPNWRKRWYRTRLDSLVVFVTNLTWSPDVRNLEQSRPFSKRIQIKDRYPLLKMHPQLYSCLLVRLPSVLHPFMCSLFHLRQFNFPNSMHQTVHHIYRGSQWQWREFRGGRLLLKECNNMNYKGWNTIIWHWHLYNIF